jgi:ribosomal protein L11 methyltransferase
MEYLELSLAVRGETVEAAADLLRRYAPSGVSIEPTAEATDEDGGSRIDANAPVRLRAWLPANAEGRAAVAALRPEVRTLTGVVRALHARVVKDASWAEVWKKHFRPMRVGRSIVIKPSWRTYKGREGAVVIELDPGMAFGTGQHATTQLCLEAIEELVTPGVRVLDVGCGSGILSIAAVLLGAERVDAVDIDPLAVRATAENATRNGVTEPIRVASGSLGEVWPLDGEMPDYDLVLANVNSRVVQSLAGELVDALAANGVLIASGIIEEQEALCRNAIESVGGRVVAAGRRDGWVALVARRA